MDEHIFTNLIVTLCSLHDLNKFLCGCGLILQDERHYFKE